MSVLQVYCADTLFVPTPTPRITPAREGLLATREALGVQMLPEVRRLRFCRVWEG